MYVIILHINVEAERFCFIMDRCGNYCESVALAGLSTICIVRSVRDIHRNVEIEKDVASAQHHYAFEKKVLVRRMDRPMYGDASMPWAEVVTTGISSLSFKASEGVQGRFDKGPSSERYVQSAMNGLSNSVRLQNPLLSELSELSEELIARLTKQTARNFEPIIRLQQKPEDATTKTFVVASVLSKHSCLCCLFAAPWTISLGWAGSLKCLCSSVYGVVSTSLRGWMKPSMY